MDIALIVCACVSSVFGFNFNTKDVSEIHVEKNIYFGYSLLLQKGTQSSVIVGAPRQDGTSGGSIYRCFLDGNCLKYNFSVNSENSFNGNYLGAALDGSDNVGEPFFACAPRFVNAAKDNYYLNGWCLFKKNSVNYHSNYDFTIKPLERENAISKDIRTGAYFYDHGFGEAGLAIHYIKKAKKVLLGAPGVKIWNGALVVQDLNNLQRYTIIPQQTLPSSKSDGYLGYEVTSGCFDANRKNIWYLVGAPKANKLLGKVKIFDEYGNNKLTITGDEMGSYFGSSIVAVDLNNDRIDDLLVGAPTGAGYTWDEGYVYYYKSNGNKFESVTKLYGSRKAGARFGTSIVSLGDIDLDSYNDIAISAPYENKGEGAVYIYMGSETGLKVSYSQRLSPMSFSGNFGNVKGFGLGLSKGVDIDGNGHNDLAIGAYKSNQVFVVKTINVVDCELTLESNISSISSDSMNIKYCGRYTLRSKTSIISTISVKLELLLDYRTKGETHFVDFWNVTLSKNYCKSVDITMKQYPADISPFKISLKTHILGNFIGIGNEKLDKFIPYSHGCGDDDICQTQILMDVLAIPSTVVLGLNKEIAVTVTAENVGEPGYDCNLYLNFPTNLEFRDKRDCNFVNSTYICLFATRLIVKKEVQFKFDIKSMNSVPISNVQINFELKCLGENTPSEIKQQLTLDVSVINSPYIVGKSEPENFYYSDERVLEDVEISHIFAVGNSGPSPVKLNVTLLLPLAKYNGDGIFEIVETKGTLNGIQVQCFPRNKTKTYDKWYNPESVLAEPLNRTVVIDCFEEDMECLEIFCEGGYLHKSTETAEYNVKIIVKTNFLISRYKSILGEKDIIAYISTALLYNATNRIEGQSATLIFGSSRKPVPIWIYIIGALVGIILLMLVILVLYKCHFFDRYYRDKINDEKLMDQQKECECNSDGESEVQFQQLET